MPISGRKFLLIIIIGGMMAVITIGIIYHPLFTFDFGINKTQKGIQETEVSEVPKKEVQEVEIFEPALLGWQEVKTPIPWSPRDSHALLVYRDKLWLMGGLNGNDFVEAPGRVRYEEAPHFSDVWVSEDGMSWSLVTDKAPWGKRRSIQAVVFQDKIWMIPGWGPLTGLKSEVWSSEDGLNWTKVTSNPGWSAREGHQLVVFKDKLWLIGSVNYETRETKNDVWYSEDGINWFEAVSNAPWLPRWDHEVVVFKNKLWLIGGMDLNNNIFGDVWVSKNGKDWSLVTDNPPWPARQGHELVVFKDRIWIIGRLNSPNQGGGNNDVWFSEDGINWEKTKKIPPWEEREDHAAVVFRDRIWIMGGMDINWTWRDDVWYSVSPH